MYKCGNCKKKFTSKYLLDKHLNREIPCTQEIKCKECGKKFEKKIDLERHYLRKTPCVKVHKNENFYLEIEKEKTKREEEKTRRELEKIKLKAELKKEEIKLRNKISEVTGDQKSKYCYVITNEIYEKNNLFKFGRTSCNIKDLISCYSRGLPNPKVLLFYETESAIEDESFVLNHFKDYRLDNGDRKLEWLKMDFNLLRDFLDIYFIHSKEEIMLEDKIFL